ncbi:MAG TPA: thioredoxin domain-containing protein [Candidatus Baltobacteraceae bacterium]|nr:thioredoxin domain-containing protein [Candidatus Baltobacteraceae bacterium]
MSPRHGLTSLGATLIVGLVLALFSLFAWRVWTYYRLISSGESVQLPQFSSQFSAARDAAAVSRAAIDLATPDDPSIGPADAKLTVVEFLDYQCPFCNQVSSTFREAAATYGDRVRFIVRDFPVQELHPDALAAAEAAGCAEAQGKFWPMHDRLFALKGVMARTDLDRAAAQSGLEMGVYAACMDLHARIDEIQADAVAGVTAGVRGTPTFFFNGQPVEGAIPREAFDAIIKRFLEASR